MAKEPKKLLKIDNVLTTGQIAKFCNVDPRTVTRWIQQQLLVAHTLPITRFHRVLVKDFLQFLGEQKMPVPDELKYATRHRILVVDDDPLMLNSIRRLLSNFDEEKYEHKTVHDGFDAGRAVQKFQPELIILDLKMPGMDGFEVCKQIKSDPDTRYIKILAISGATSTEDKQRILTLGADSFLGKPFSEQVLKDRIFYLLNGEDR